MGGRSAGTATIARETWRLSDAQVLLAWSQMVCFDGALAKAEPKTMRYRVLHIAALLVHKSRGLTLRLDKTWPWANDLCEAFARLRAAIP